MWCSVLGVEAFIQVIQRMWYLSCLALQVEISY